MCVIRMDDSKIPIIIDAIVKGAYQCRLRVVIIVVKYLCKIECEMCVLNSIIVVFGKHAKAISISESLNNKTRKPNLT